MSFRHLLPAISIVSILAFVTTLLAQNRDTEDFGSELRKLRLSYRDELLKLVEIYETRERVGVGTQKSNLDALVNTQVVLADIEAKIAASPAEKIAALESSVAKLKKWEESQKSVVEGGVTSAEGLAKCTAARIYVEIMVVEERERQAKEK